jgi:NitT/TauT family transport system permease protein
MTADSPATRSHQYLRPSTFWSIRQGFPKRWAVLIFASSLMLPIGLWLGLSYGGVVSALFLPTPTAVLQAGIKLFMEQNLGYDIWVSCGRVMGGFALAGLIGVPLGLAIGTFHSMEHLFAPFVGLVRYLPITALVPLIMIWLGLGEITKIAIITLSIVFYNAVMVADAVKFIPNDLINVAYTLGGSRWDVLRRVIVPATFPTVLDTLRVNMCTAWNFLVIAEVIAAQNGLGIRITRSQRFFHTEEVLFCIIVIGVIGLAIDYALKRLSAYLTPWADQTRL